MRFLTAKRAPIISCSWLPLQYLLKLSREASEGAGRPPSLFAKPLIYWGF
jgi:hypothetical protein